MPLLGIGESVEVIRDASVEQRHPISGALGNIAVTTCKCGAKVIPSHHAEKTSCPII